jgi:hypothetical protein
MHAIFDRNGRTVGWLDDETIRDRQMRHRAFIEGDGVFSFGGSHRGSFADGYFRDKRGDAIAFVQSATGGPMTPIPEIPPIPAIPPIAPIPPLPPIPPIAPIGSFSWSRMSWDDFLGS